MTEIGRGINQDPFISKPQKYGGTEASVPGIQRRADLAVAPDHRHAHARAGAEHEYRRMLELVEHLFGLASLAPVGGDDKRAIVLFFVLFFGDRGGFGFVLDL